jgi:hypothetical protein
MARVWAVVAVALGLAFGQAASAGAADWTLLKAQDAGFSAELPGQATYVGTGADAPEQWLLVGGDGVYAIFLSPTDGAQADEAVLDAVLDNSVEALAGEVQQRWTTDTKGGPVRWARFAGQASNLTVEGQAIAIARPGTVLVAVALTPEGGDPANVARFLGSVTLNR